MQAEPLGSFQVDPFLGPHRGDDLRLDLALEGVAGRFVHRRGGANDRQRPAQRVDRLLGVVLAKQGACGLETLAHVGGELLPEHLLACSGVLDRGLRLSLRPGGDRAADLPHQRHAPDMRQVVERLAGAGVARGERQDLAIERLGMSDGPLLHRLAAQVEQLIGQRGRRLAPRHCAGHEQASQRPP